MDVVHGVAASGRAGEVALYTGNDDHIVMDLLTDFPAVDPNGAPLHQQMVGGLLRQWAVWARNAVQLLDDARLARSGDNQALRRLVEINPRLTDANAALFDSVNHFRGSVAGVHEVLRRQGLLAGGWFLDENEGLSPGQAAEIDRIWQA